MYIKKEELYDSFCCGGGDDGYYYYYYIIININILLFHAEKALVLGCIGQDRQNGIRIPTEIFTKGEAKASSVRPCKILLFLRKQQVTAGIA